MILDYTELLKSSDYQLYETVILNNEYSVFLDDIKDRIVLDIGANIGMFTGLALKLGARKVIAVEPIAETYKKLEELYRYDIRVKTQNKCLWYEDGIVFNFDTDTSESRMIVDGKFSATSITLLSLFKKYDLLYNRDLILKMEIEGAEHDILHNTSPDIIRKFEYIFIEIHEQPKLVDVTKYSIDKLKEYLYSIGYEIKETNPYYWKEYSNHQLLKMTKMPMEVSKFKRI